MAAARAAHSLTFSARFSAWAAGDVLASALDWIEADDPRPWFCFVNLYDVHWPYLPGPDGMALVNEYTGPLDGYLFRSDDWVLHNFAGNGAQKVFCESELSVGVHN